MASLPSLKVVSSKPGSSPAAIASGLDAALQALGSISLTAFDLLMHDDVSRAGATDVALTYFTPGNLSYRCASFIQTAANSIDAQYATFFDADVNLRPVFVRDLTSDFARRTGAPSVLVVYATTPEPARMPFGSRPVILRNATGASIAVGAEGSVTIRTSTGSLATVTAKNAGNIAWKTGQEAFGIVDISATTYLAYPNCCST